MNVQEQEYSAELSWSLCGSLWDEVLGGQMESSEQGISPWAKAAEEDQTSV